MSKNRLEAFSDGVLAIIITIMVLELKVPHGTDLAALGPVIPVFLSYVVSFLYIAIYWNNHHHMLHTVQRVSGPILWANMGLLFWLSLVPFVTAWVGENHVAPIPVAGYGVVLFLAGLSYLLLQIAIIRSQGKNSRLQAAVGRDWKGRTSLLCYAVAVALAFIQPWIAIALYAGVALMWLAPDRRIERELNRTQAE